MRVAAAIAFLQMKRWGHRWLTVTCWFGVVLWIGYISNMTMYADLRFGGTILPVLGWWAYDIMFITVTGTAVLHTVSREIFSIDLPANALSDTPGFPVNAPSTSRTATASGR